MRSPSGPDCSSHCCYCFHRWLHCRSTDDDDGERRHRPRRSPRPRLHAWVARRTRHDDSPWSWRTGVWRRASRRPRLQPLRPPSDDDGGESGRTGGGGCRVAESRAAETRRRQRPPLRRPLRLLLRYSCLNRARRRRTLRCLRTEAPSRRWSRAAVVASRCVRVATPYLARKFC